MKEHKLVAAVSIQYRLLMAAVLTLGLAPQLFAAPIVVPNSLESVAGDSMNSYPFNISGFSMNSQRYQQVYAASEFGSDPLLIGQIAFRPSSDIASAFDAVISSVQINLSTTAKNPGSLSSTFADNVGSDDTVVFSGSLPLSSANTGGPPRNFDITIILQTPFPYNPSLGNLLLDIRNFSASSSSTTYFDSQGQGSGPISRAYTTSSGDVNSLEANYLMTGGLVTQFDFVDLVIQVDIDIQFCGDPNALNCKKKGVVPVTIFGSELLDVEDIDLDTVRLCLEDLETCTEAPVDFSVADRGTAPDDLGTDQCAIVEDPPLSGIYVEQATADEFYDLDVVFDAAEVKAILYGDGSEPGDFCDNGAKGDVSEAMVIMGETTSGQPFVSIPVDDIGVDQLKKANK